jgi:tRNA dimethylallyltransferase
VLAVIVGATGTGKTELSLDLADALRAEGRAVEIVNADAMQLYRGMDIGTAKLPVAKRRGIPHHLLDVLDVTDEANVADYQRRARETIAKIIDRGALPILVGGSGLYVSSIIYDFQFPGRDPAVRARLEEELSREGPNVLHSRLLDLDPAAAQTIGASNGRRIVRALEVIEITGKPFRPGRLAGGDTWLPSSMVGLRTPREELVRRLDERVRGMWRAGLVEEVRNLLPLGIQHGVTASHAIGYAQAIAQLAGSLTESEAIEQTAALTRRYARRQVGWFGRDTNIHWLQYDAPDRVELARQLVLTNG